MPRNAPKGRLRAMISNVSPQIEGGRFAIKRVIGDQVAVTADIFTNGHQEIAASLLFHHSNQKKWQEIPMQLLENDQWIGRFCVDSIGCYFYTIIAWVDEFRTWQKDLQKKFQAHMDICVDLQVGMKMMKESLQLKPDVDLQDWLAAIVEAKNADRAVALASDSLLHLLMRDRPPNRQWISQFPINLPVTVDPPKALFSTWYEVFPRSISAQIGKHGTFKDCEALIPEIAKMGFDILYFPPIHPIGMSKRKGKNNHPQATTEDVGSPWAIGSKEGGHLSIHPSLGSIEDFEHLVACAKQYRLEIALDIAFQCSPDHPYLSEHPNWFRWRPDHTIQHAENPPKKYEDIVPFNFETEEWKELWNELKEIVFYWIEKGVRIFRVDNPHTKPFLFWEWLINQVKHVYPDAIFLSEAFTRPKVMYWLAKVGFTQSYTYFTWRHTKRELVDYLTELTTTEAREYFRPNFWPNTPDILTEELQYGGKSIFLIRLILAATLSSNYGVYGPAFELMVSEAVPGTEEYLNAEKYESKYWQRQTAESLKDFMTLINRIRRENPALQQTNHLKFYEIDNDQILYYGKSTMHPFNALLILVSLDPFNAQSGTLTIPLKDLGLKSKGSYRVHELLSDRHYIWEEENRQITLNPRDMPAYIFKIHRKIRREVDFDYFM